MMVHSRAALTGALCLVLGDSLQFTAYNLPPIMMNQEYALSRSIL